MTHLFSHLLVVLVSSAFLFALSPSEASAGAGAERAAHVVRRTDGVAGSQAIEWPIARPPHG
jgi:hypothetical protein